MEELKDFCVDDQKVISFDDDIFDDMLNGKEYALVRIKSFGDEC